MSETGTSDEERARAEQRARNWEAARGRPVPMSQPKKTQPAESPTSYMVGGIIAVLAGLAMFAVGGAIAANGAGGVGIVISSLGVALAVVGQVLTLVGVIAAGVRVGMRWHHHDVNG